MTNEMSTIFLMDSTWGFHWVVFSLSFSAIVWPELNFGLPPRCLQAVWVVWCVGNNPLKYSAVAGNWTRATGRTDSKIHPFSHWAIVTDWMVYLYKNNFYPMESKHLAWQYILLQSNSLQWVINSMNMPMMVIQTTGSKASVMMQVICPLKWASTELKKKLIWNQNIL